MGVLLAGLAFMAGAVLWGSLAFSQARNGRLARALLWLGAVGPYIATTAKETTEVVSGLGLLDAVRGGVPIVCYLTARIIAHPPRLPWGRTERALAVFLAVALASTLWSISPTTTLLKAIVLTFAYLNLLELRRHYRTREAAINALAVVVHLLLALAFLQIPLKAATAVDVFRMGLVYPTVPSNLFATVAVVGLVIVLVGVGPAWARPIPVRALLVVLYLVALLSTRTRSALAISAVVLLVVAIRAARRTAWAAVFASFAGAALMGFAALNIDTVTEFLLRGQDARNVTTLTGRTVIWDIALRAWESSPLLGLGYYAGHRIGLDLPQNYSNLDNTWIESLVDVGILGTVPLALFVLGGLGRALRRGADDPPVAIVAAAVALYGTAISFVNPTVQDANTNMLLMGMVFLLAPATAKPAEPGRSSDRALAHRARRHSRPDRVGFGALR